MGLIWWFRRHELLREAPIPMREPSQLSCPSCPVRDFRDFYEEDMEVWQRQMPRVYFQKKCPRFFSKLKKNWKNTSRLAITAWLWPPPGPHFGPLFGPLFWPNNEKNAKSYLRFSGGKWSDLMNCDASCHLSSRLLASVDCQEPHNRHRSSESSQIFTIVTNRFS